MDKPSCEEYRGLAASIMKVQVPTDGTWSDDYDHKNNTKKTSVSAINRPRLYYAEVLDCNNELLKYFSTGQFPRLATDIHFTTNDGENEFSYEDMGLLRLYVVLLILLGGLFVLMIKTFRQYLQTENTWLAPHPIIIIGIFFQVVAMFFQMMHLWSYSENGTGNTLCDVLSKVLQGFSEVTISLLLITMASGWKLRFHDVDVDDGLEIYLPMTALVLMIQIILAALTFVDIDASHKYHDFAGIQGWCLVALKTILFGYFWYCIYDSQKQAKKNASQLSYLSSLLGMGAAYLMAIPGTVIITFMFEAYER